MADAFQPDAFQIDAFQIDAAPPPSIPPDLLNAKLGKLANEVDFDATIAGLRL